jgi:hypothetical protein
VGSSERKLGHHGRVLGGDIGTSPHSISLSFSGGQEVSSVLCLVLPAVMYCLVTFPEIMVQATMD